MKFFDKFKKKQVTIPAKKEETKRKQYTVPEMEKFVNDLQNDIIQKIGKGEFTLGFDLGIDAKIYAVLFLNKNDPVYNSLFRDLFWKQKRFEYIELELKYEGFMDYCKAVADDHGIKVELTEWSVENILIDYETVDSSSCGRFDYFYNSQKTVAYYARKLCFAW